MQLVGRICEQVHGQAQVTGRPGSVVERNAIISETGQRLRVSLLANTRGAAMTERLLGLELERTIEMVLTKERLWKTLSELAVPTGANEHDSGVDSDCCSD